MTNNVLHIEGTIPELTTNSKCKVLCPRLNEMIQKQYNRVFPNGTYVNDLAPSTFLELSDCSNGSMVIWSGASDMTIFGDASINYMFRAIHDSMHLSNQLLFIPEHEIEIGRIHASQFDGVIADIVYNEIAGQVKYFERTGKFVENQYQFALNQLNLK